MTPPPGSPPCSAGAAPQLAPSGAFSTPGRCAGTGSLLVGTPKRGCRLVLTLRQQSPLVSTFTCLLLMLHHFHVFAGQPVVCGCFVGAVRDMNNAHWHCRVPSIGASGGLGHSCSSAFTTFRRCGAVAGHHWNLDSLSSAWLLERCCASVGMCKASAKSSVPNPCSVSKPSTAVAPPASAMAPRQQQQQQQQQQHAARPAQTARPQPAAPGKVLPAAPAPGTQARPFPTAALLSISGAELTCYEQPLVDMYAAELPLQMLIQPLLSACTQLCCQGFQLPASRPRWTTGRCAPPTGAPRSPSSGRSASSATSTKRCGVSMAHECRFTVP